jgi:hypothetical protein
VLLICRSGQRTLDAGAALEAAGFKDVTNVLEGFEGQSRRQFSSRHAGRLAQGRPAVGTDVARQNPPGAAREAAYGATG